MTGIVDNHTYRDIDLLHLANRVYRNVTDLYNILAEDDNYFLANKDLEYVIIDKQGGIKSRIIFEPGRDIFRERHYFCPLVQIKDFIEYDWWFNPPKLIQRGKAIRDQSLNTLRVKEYFDRIEIFSFHHPLNNPKEVKFVLKKERLL